MPRPTPPKPRLTLRIGVTGHRPNRFDEAAQRKTAAALERLFAQAKEAAKALLDRERPFFAGDGPDICVVSALAEGADRVVAQAGLEAGFPLDALLPFPAAVYETDFKSEESKAAFRAFIRRARACFSLPGEKSDADPAIANRAYEAVGLMTLRQCDLLIAVWDGKPAAGRGGTETIVQNAAASGRPVLRFDERGNGPFLLMQSSGAPADACELAASIPRDAVADADVVASVVERLCAPPAAEPGGAKQKESARARLERFLGEHEWRLTILAFFYPLLLCLLGKNKLSWRIFFQPRYSEGAAIQWDAYWKALGNDARLYAPIRDTVMARFTWADGLANYYGQLHRSGYISNYTFAAFAVACAALSMLKIGGEWPEFGELGAIAIIAVTTYHGKYRFWHKCWLDYRQLSAQLRHLRALVLTGSTSFESHQVHPGEEGTAGAQWVNWYCRMTAREIGVLDRTVDPAYISLAREAIAMGEVADQLGYHNANAARMHRIEDKLETISFWSFAAPFAICVLEILLNREQVGDVLFAFAALLTVVLPAIGAGLFGIRVHGDFQGSADRSNAMAKQLNVLLARFTGSEGMRFSELSALTEHAVMLMASELGDWGFVYRGRPLALPA